MDGGTGRIIDLEGIAIAGLDRFERLDNITGNDPRPDRINNGYFLRLGFTVWNDGGDDTLIGGRGKDWFLLTGDDWAVDIGIDDSDELLY